MLSPASNLDETIRHIFSDPRFQKTGQRRLVGQVDGQWIGVVVAWRPPDRENFALNQEDLARVLEKLHDGSLDAGFVVLATFENSTNAYVDHRGAVVVHEMLRNDPPRDGPHGPYWLLQKSFAEMELLAEALKRF